MALELLINEKPVTSPKEWRDLQIQASFGANTDQPSIESDRFTIVLDGAEIVKKHIADGKIFEELSASMKFGRV